MWGRDFYTTFPANELADYGTSASLTFELLISASIQTHVSITQGPTKFALDTIIAANTTASVLLPSGVECQSTEVVESNKAIHITADAAVQVVAISSKTMTSDAWVVYPTNILGTSYRPLCFNASVNPMIFGTGLDHPSEFTVTATENNTQVTIAPHTMTMMGSVGPLTYTLNAGDVVQIWGSIIDSSMDLTGSLISSDKPIAVLSGHRRTECPSYYTFTDNSGAIRTSRDFLCEQMPPITAWAKQALVIPLTANEPQTLVRVLSASDNNVISVDGVNIGVIQAGQFVQIDSIGRSLIEGTGPILVGEYLHTASGVNAQADPSLSIADRPPVVGGIHHLTAITNPTGFTFIFSTIIAKKSDVGSIMIDGAPINPAAANPIGATGYSFVRFSLSAGDHIVSSTAPYTASVCGLGQVTSYTYTFPTSLFADPKLSAPTESAVIDRFRIDRIAPNPVNSGNSIQAHVQAPAGTQLQWALYDAAGRNVSGGSTVTHGDGVLSVVLDAQLQNGIYLLRVNAFGPSGTVLHSSAEKIVLAR